MSITEAAKSLAMQIAIPVARLRIKTPKKFWTIPMSFRAQREIRRIAGNRSLAVPGMAGKKLPLSCLMHLSTAHDRLA